MNILIKLFIVIINIGVVCCRNIFVRNPFSKILVKVLIELECTDLIRVKSNDTKN